MEGVRAEGDASGCAPPQAVSRRRSASLGEQASAVCRRDQAAVPLHDEEVLLAGARSRCDARRRASSSRLVARSSRAVTRARSARSVATSERRSGAAGASRGTRDRPEVEEAHCAEHDERQEPPGESQPAERPAPATARALRGLRPRRRILRARAALPRGRARARRRPPAAPSPRSPSALVAPPTLRRAVRTPFACSRPADRRTLGGRNTACSSRSRAERRVSVRSRPRLVTKFGTEPSPTRDALLDTVTSGHRGCPWGWLCGRCDWPPRAARLRRRRP